MRLFGYYSLLHAIGDYYFVYIFFMFCFVFWLIIIIIKNSYAKRVFIANWGIAAIFGKLFCFCARKETVL